jgi:hypothetical protein
MRYTQNIPGSVLRHNLPYEEVQTQVQERQTIMADAANTDDFIESPKI